ncbi:hypothetical protein KIN20_028876 [Parelaphostrongylus tenuis]|uniref:EF-hand domain-containing protein n=1 Tax=Parelaphostrongylus tenuis TaxID=148309 RepID=A0AAD5WF54_PARTN|nr:hypothetical protein KIN20_028876 [Parelaphostrongylus tenuis]
MLITSVGDLESLAFTYTTISAERLKSNHQSEDYFSKNLPSSSGMFVLLIVIMVGAVICADVPQTITPIPFDKINPRANEFRRLDTDGNERITFTEFILGDHYYIERQSAAFHKLDEDGDGVVSRGEYDAYYKKVDDDRRRSDIDHDRFFERIHPIEGW